MRKIFKAKLNRARGATMIMAMLMLLLAVFVSSMALTGSVTAVRNKRNERTQLQNKLLLSSAADYISDEIGKTCIDNLLHSVQQIDLNSHEIISDVLIEDKNVRSESGDSDIINSFVCLGIASAKKGDSFRRTLDFSVNEKEKDIVTAELFMDKDFSITLVLSINQSTEPIEQLVLKFASEKNELYAGDYDVGLDYGKNVENVEFTDYIITNHYTWEKPEIIKGWEK